MVTEIVEKVVEVEKIVNQPVRRKLPRSRRSRTFEFRVADCKGFATIGEYDNGQPGEIFLTVSKQGSTMSGIMDAFAKSISYGLQYGVPLRAFVEAFTNMRFEPAGMTDDPDIRFATSVMDYLFRRLALEYLSYDERAELGIFSVDERLQPTLPGVEETVDRDVGGHRVRARPEVGALGERTGRADRTGCPADDAGGQHRRPRRRASHRRLGGTSPRGCHERRPAVHAVRRADDPRRQLPRLPELRQHQRLQLSGRDVYTHGHHDSVLRSHRWRTAANSAAYLLAHLRPGMRLLDVGCGPGTLTADLARTVAPGSVTGSTCPRRRSPRRPATPQRKA